MFLAIFTAESHLAPAPRAVDSNHHRGVEAVVAKEAEQGQEEEADAAGAGEVGEADRDRRQKGAV